MNIVCLDLEGVLIPEIWIAFAEQTGIEALKRTTRDEPDYDELMRYRLEILNREGFKLTDIEEVIGALGELLGLHPGALHDLCGVDPDPAHARGKLAARPRLLDLRCRHLDPGDESLGIVRVR